MVCRRISQKARYQCCAIVAISSASFDDSRPVRHCRVAVRAAALFSAYAYRSCSPPEAFLPSKSRADIRWCGGLRRNIFYRVCLLSSRQGVRDPAHQKVTSVPIFPAIRCGISPKNPMARATGITAIMGRVADSAMVFPALLIYTSPVRLLRNCRFISHIPATPRPFSRIEAAVRSAVHTFS